MDLVTRDHRDHGGSDVLTCQPGHVEVERYRSATKWATGAPRQYRIGATIGPHRYSDLGAWDAAAPRELDAWPAIDLRAGLSARAGVRAAVSRCGYACDWGEDYGLTVRRGGVAVHLLPVALAWVNDRGQQQIIATPVPGRPVVTDDAGLWALDAFGPGIDLGARLWPDMLRAPVVRINNPAALFTGLSRPTIDPKGLRLAKVLNVGHEGGQPDRDLLFRQSRFRRTASATRHTGRADETRRDPGKVPVLHTRGAALWFGEGRAWDDEQGWALRHVWSRYDDEVTLALSMAAEDVATAVGALCLDTTMTEEQVGASADDCSRSKGTSDYWSITDPTHSVGYLSSTYKYLGGADRWTPPIPQGATIDSAATSYRSNGNDSNTLVKSSLAAQATDSADAFSTMADFDGRSWSIQSIAWDSIDAWASATWYTSPDLSSIIQSVTDRVGWSESNGLVVAWNDWDGRSDQEANHYRSCRTYNYTGNVSGPKLNATYTESAPAGGQPFALRTAGIAHMGLTGFRPGRGW